MIYKNFQFFADTNALFNVLISESSQKLCERNDNMSLFKRKSKGNDDIITKHMLNIPILDLRSYSADGLKNVRILNAAVVVLPKEPNDEIMGAYGSIPRKNVATEIFAENDAQVHILNGISEVDCALCNERDIYIVNGMAAVKNSADRTVNLIINGLTVYENGANINFINRNGKACAVDFDIKSVKILTEKASVDREFIENIEDGTVVLCGKALTLEVDITPEILKGRKLLFAAGNTLKCAKRTLSIIQTMSGTNEYKTFL